MQRHTCVLCGRVFCYKPIFLEDEVFCESCAWGYEADELASARHAEAMMDLMTYKNVSADERLEVLRGLMQNYGRVNIDYGVFLEEETDAYDVGEESYTHCKYCGEECFDKYSRREHEKWCGGSFGEETEEEKVKRIRKESEILVKSRGEEHDGEFGEDTEI